MKSDVKYKRWHLKCVLTITTICLFSIVEPRVEDEIDLSYNVCHTEDCNSTATSILNNMDDKVKPCDDVYQFVCGKFTPESNRIATMVQKLYSRIESIMKEEYQDNEPRSLNLVKTLYKSCINDNSMEDIINLKQKFIKYTDNLGGWPVLLGDDWNEEKFDWMQYVDEFYKLGYIENSIIFIDISLNAKNTSQNVIYLTQANLELSRNSVIEGFNNTDVKSYFDEMVNLAVNLGANKTKALEELEKVVKFEMELAKISLPENRLRNLTALYNPMTLYELEERFISIPWKKFFNNFLTPSGYQVTQDELVIVREPSYINNLDKLLKKTDKRVLSNYIMWNFFKYLQNIIGPRNCVKIISDNLRYRVDAQYIKKYFDKSVKNITKDMFTNIKAELAKILQTVPWLDEQTRTNALEKLTSMGTLIAYMDNILDDSKLEKYYEKLEISEDDYLQSILNLTIFHKKLAFDSLRKQVDKTDWPEIAESRSLEPFYVPARNIIMIPAAMLQNPFFSKDLPTYMNYGALGNVIAHEMTHGFSYLGMDHDKDGNLFNWWANDTRKLFFDKAKCMIDQYGSYEVAEVSMKVNGSLTVMENIADNGGIKLAYRAYDEWAKQNKEEKRLPGGLKSYTPRQMFWINYANIWCHEYDPKDLEYYMKTNPHTHPTKFRIQGVFSNMPEFSRDFNCAPNSTMNVQNRCVVW